MQEYLTFEKKKQLYQKGNINFYCDKSQCTKVTVIAKCRHLEVDDDGCSCENDFSSSLNNTSKKLGKVKHLVETVIK